MSVRVDLKKAAIGVDIGGGSVKLGLVLPNGRIVDKSFFATPIKESKTYFLDVLSAHIADLRQSAKEKNLRVSGIGIGAPGPIDVERGFVYFFPNIPGWKNTPLKSILERILNLPVFVDNDANAMALAEYWFGAGRGCQSAVCLTLGTGIGGGIILNGKLFHGSTFSAAEIGHIIIDENGPLCACGNHGCIETFVGTQYFKREVERRLKKQKSILHRWLKKDKAKLSPALVGKAARCGDALARQMWKDVAAKLGIALSGLVNVLNPQKIILGGGIAENRNLFFAPLNKTLSEKTFPIAWRSVKVVPAKLRQDAGLVGAAALVFASKESIRIS